MTWHGASDALVPPQSRSPHAWSAHAIANAAFVRAPQDKLPVVLKVIAAACVERGFDVPTLLLDLETIQVPQGRYGRDDTRTAEMIFAPYPRLLSNEMMKYAFRRCAAACQARGIDINEVLESS